MRVTLFATIGVALGLAIAASAFLLQRHAPPPPEEPPKPWPIDYWLECNGFDGFKDCMERDGECREYSVESHPLLREDVRIVTWIYDVIHPESFCRALFVDGRDVPLERVEDLVPYVSGLESAEEAFTYSNLVRQLVPFSLSPNNRYLGTVLTLNTEPWIGWWKVSHAGGRFSPRDARRWRIPKEPVVRVVDDGFVIDRPVLLAARPYQAGAKGWQVVLRREWIGHRGAYRAETLRVLEEDGTPWHTILE